MTSWLPLYFNQQFGVKLQSVGWFVVLPYLGMTVASNSGGQIGSYLVRWDPRCAHIFIRAHTHFLRFHSRGHSTTFVRKLMQSLAFLLPSCFFMLLWSVQDSLVALVSFCSRACHLVSTPFSQVFVTLAMTGAALSQVGFWTNIIDISPKYAGA